MGRSFPSQKIEVPSIVRWTSCMLSDINNQCNTCFWMLVKSGKSKAQAQDYLKGTQTREKSELLSYKFGIEYNTLPVIFRMGSSGFRVKTQEGVAKEHGAVLADQMEDVVVDHSNIIDSCF